MAPFITLEGGEGVGKSTQAIMLQRRLAALGREVVVTREPGGSHRAELIREIVLAGRAARYGAFAETALFAAARMDHVARTIEPALRRGAVVVCDRFIDSTRVYQSAAGGVPIALVRRFEDAAAANVRPDLTVVLDLAVEHGLARADNRRGRGAPDRFEGEGALYHERIRAAFLAIAAAEPDRCVVVDAGGGEEVVAMRVWSAIQAHGLRLSAPHGA